MNICKTKLTILFTLQLVFFLSSCSSIQSGQYIQLSNGSSINEIAKSYQVPVEEIRNFNIGKKFTSGEWIYIPLKRGLVNKIYRNPSSYGEVPEFIWPLPSVKKISSKFGRRKGRPHDGIDIPARSGSHILAAADGIVVYSGDGLGGYGNLTVISHLNGYFTVYAHSKKNFTKKGDKVVSGQVIAQVGNTGRSRGSHLHFEIRREGKALDPLMFIAYR